MSQEEMGRRALLVGAGCAALAMLGACGPGDEEPPGPKAGDVLTPTSGVPVGGGVLTPAGVLVLQLQEGSFTAYNAVCPHQSYLVRPPDAEGIMTCSGHQSKFRALDGVRVDGPALGNLAPIPVKVSGSEVVRA
jgi:nitrite reductase/ring-hydroxylating ferredoxin subunit